MEKDKIALLVGNDINSINNNQSWKELLIKITDHLGVTKYMDMDNSDSKPFPLLYEEIFLKSLTNIKTSEFALKQYIAKLTNCIEHNEIHEKIMSLGVKDIMTTNYEYSLQRSSKLIDKNLKNKGYINERSYSIFRYNQIDDVKVWHIHGECKAPRSITLGYEHYGGLLQQMRNYVVTGTDYSKPKNLEPLIKRIDNNEIEEHSWIDLFFTKDIHIFGITLDTSEIDLWWLLTYRARQILTKKENRVHNEIYYYYPTEYKDKSKAKLELLRANQIKTIEIKEDFKNNKKKYYLNILNRIQKLK